MALGKTIISTNIGTEGINSTHKKDIFLANTPDEFIQTILELSGNETLCERVGEKAIDLIRTNFDNTNQSAKLIDFYKEIINQKFENQN